MKALVFIIAIAATFNSFSAETAPISKLTNPVLNEAKGIIATIDYIGYHLMKKVTKVDHTQEDRQATINKAINSSCNFEDGLYASYVTRDKKGLSDINGTFYFYFDDAMPELEVRLETMKSAANHLFQDKSLEVYVGSDTGYTNEGAVLAVYDVTNSELYLTFVSRCKIK